ncbi:MAG: hypothetical protein M3126_08920 [Candidatus Eremiobacteraeota bacterium]|nr:hypothetical protein [Candidatus Eremiobacteraeota bacterium]
MGLIIDISISGFLGSPRGLIAFLFLFLAPVLLAAVPSIVSTRIRERLVRRAG